jgi:DNA-binding transcriptional regulator YhcF (GntR family)
MSRPPVLSPVRQAIFDWIVEYKASHDGNSPSVREIAISFQRSISVVHYDLSYMEAVGMIERSNNGESRMITVVGGRWEMLPEALREQPKKVSKKPVSEEMRRRLAEL